MRDDVVMTRHLLVLADSLAFHGPVDTQAPTHPDLYPNVCARALGTDVKVDLVARFGWTARDAWWALTRDPMAFGVYVNRADYLILGWVAWIIYPRPCRPGCVIRSRMCDRGRCVGGFGAPTGWPLLKSSRHQVGGCGNYRSRGPTAT